MTVNRKPRVVNFYGGPGTGKSTTAAGLFHLLKTAGIQAELIPEYAKDIAWETGDGKSKHFQAQELIFAQQNWRMRRCADQVDLIINDGPFLLGMAYIAVDFPMPSLRNVILEAHTCYDNLDIFLERHKPYSHVGRTQTEAEAKELDGIITSILTFNAPGYKTLPATQGVVEKAAALVVERWPDLLRTS